MARWLLVAPGMRAHWFVGCALVALACSGKSERSGADGSGGTGDEGSGAAAQDETGGTKSTATGGTAGTHDDSPGATGGTTAGTGSGDAGLGGEDSSTGGTDSAEEPRAGSGALSHSGGHPNVIGVAGFGGFGGFGGFAGNSGSGNGGWGGVPPPVCSLRAAELEPEAWSEVTDDQTLEERFDYVRSGIVGAWRGVVTTPWTVPYDVEAIFTEDGHYSASCMYGSNECCIAFYYGTDDDADIKRYSIDDATLSGRVTGFIDIIFGAAGSYSEAGWQGELTSVDVDATGDRARFDFQTSDGYGPIHFELERTNTK